MLVYHKSYNLNSSMLLFPHATEQQTKSSDDLILGFQKDEENASPYRNRNVLGYS
jgi:hypothetical protein